jgi:hypothetical protein
MELGPQQPFHYGSWFDDYYLVAPPDVSDPGSGGGTFGSLSAAAPAPAGVRGGVNPLADVSLDRLAIEDEPVPIADVLSRHPAAELIGLADGGDALAQHLAGYMFSLGVGVKKDVRARVPIWRSRRRRIFLPVSRSLPICCSKTTRRLTMSNAPTISTSRRRMRAFRKRRRIWPIGSRSARSDPPILSGRRRFIRKRRKKGIRRRFSL